MTGTDFGRRLFASDYTSSGQRNWPRGDNWMREMVAQLRCDLVAFNRVVIPDTHLLDGAFFMSLSPTKLADAIGLSDPLGRRGLELRLRKPTIRETLEHWLVRPKSPMLNGFQFKLIEDCQTRSEVAEVLGNTPRPRWDMLMTRHGNPAKALAALLREAIDAAPITSDQADAARATVEKAEAHWSYWMESATPTFYCKPWEGEYDLHGAMRADSIGADLITEEGRALFTETVTGATAGKVYRADFTKQITDRRQEGASPDLEQDLRLCERWYSRARYRAMAGQHRCAFAFDAGLSDGAEPFGVARTVAQEPVPETSLARFPQEFQDAITHVDGEQFAEAVHSAGGDLERWWNSHDYTALQQASEKLATRLGCMEPSFNQQRFQTYIKVGLPLAAAAVSWVFTGTAVEGGVIGLVIAAAAPAIDGVRKLTLRNRIVEGFQRRGRPVA